MEDGIELLSTEDRCMFVGSRKLLEWDGLMSHLTNDADNLHVAPPNAVGFEHSSVASATWAPRGYGGSRYGGNRSLWY